MTLRRHPSQRPQLHNLSFRGPNSWPKPALMPQGEYLAALIRSYLDFLPRVDPEYDPRGARYVILAEVARLRELQGALRDARALETA